VSPLSDSNDDLGSALGIVALIVDPDADPVSDSNQSADPNYRTCRVDRAGPCRRKGVGCQAGHDRDILAHVTRFLLLPNDENELLSWSRHEYGLELATEVRYRPRILARPHAYEWLLAGGGVHPWDA
jgi:hypothetical protein